MITEIKDIDPTKIQSIKMDWFYSENDLTIPGIEITYYHYDISVDSVKVNKDPDSFSFSVDGKTTVITQGPSGLTIKSNQYFNRIEAYPIEMYASEKGLVFILTEEQERQMIYVKFK